MDRQDRPDSCIGLDTVVAANNRPSLYPAVIPNSLPSFPPPYPFILNIVEG